MLREGCQGLQCGLSLAFTYRQHYLPAFFRGKFLLGVEEVAPRDVNMTPYLVPHAMLKK